MRHDLRLLMLAVLGLPWAAGPCAGGRLAADEPKPPVTPITTADVGRFNKLIEHSVDFFEAHARDNKTGSYYTNIRIDGSRVNDVRHIVASGRMLYALSHSSRLNEKYKDHARHLRDYILRAMTAKEEGVGPYFRVAVGDDGKDVGQPPTELFIHHQAYGLCGLVASYSVAPSIEELIEIEAFYTAFRQRYKDAEEKGFLHLYTLPADGRPGKASATKNFNSTVYVATAFLLELHDAVNRVQTSKDADPKHRELARKVYEIAASDLAELAEATANKLAAADGTGFIVESFDAQWNPAWPDNLKAGDDTIGIVGHNFQAAWFLLRASQMPSASKEQQAAYKAKAAEILKSMLGKPEKAGAAPVDSKLGGFHNGFRRASGELHTEWGSDKHWWQQAEGILALTLAEKLGVVTDPEALDARDKALQFFVDNFVDDEDDRGMNGEFKVVTREGKPRMEEPKGEPGKSAYHTVELYRYLIEYAGQR